MPGAEHYLAEGIWSHNTGKTRGCLEKCHALALKYPNSRGLIVRKTRASLETTALQAYRRQVASPDVEIVYRGARYPNGSTIDFGGMDKSSRIMSSDYDWIYVPEATELALDEWETLTTRLRWGRVPYQQIVGDCNPQQPTHWLNQRMEAGKALRLRSRHEDNPLLWENGDWTEFGRRYIATLDELTGVRYYRLRMGLWRAAEGIVYEDWDPAKHLVERFPIPQDWPRVWSVDFGYTNAFVWQAWARDPDGRMFRYREIYRSRRVVEDHARDMLRVATGEPIPRAVICDHDAEDRATLERHLGFVTTPAYKAVRPGIEAVQKRLRPAGDGKPRIFLMRDALVERDETLAESHKPTSTEEEIEGYVWASGTRGGKPVDEPVKRDDHGCDAMRYAVAAADGLHYDPSEQEEFVQVLRPYRISPI